MVHTLGEIMYMDPDAIQQGQEKVATTH